MLRNVMFAVHLIFPKHLLFEVNKAKYVMWLSVTTRDLLICCHYYHSYVLNGTKNHSLMFPIKYPNLASVFI